MACNCATSQQIEEIYRKFGNRIKPTGKESFLFKMNNFFVNILASTTFVVIIPLVVFYVSANYAQGKNQISLAEFFGLRKTTNVIDNVR